MNYLTGREGVWIPLSAPRYYYAGLWNLYPTLIEYLAEDSL